MILIWPIVALIAVLVGSGLAAVRPVDIAPQSTVKVLVGTTHCSGVHLGNGVVLTAAHCTEYPVKGIVTMLITPFDLLAMNQGHRQLARAVDTLGAYQGVVAASRRSWAAKNGSALEGFVRAYRAGVSFVFENKDVAEALLVARPASPARRS